MRISDWSSDVCSADRLCGRRRTKMGRGFICDGFALDRRSDGLRRIDLLIELQAESLALAPNNSRLDGVDVVKQHSNLLTLPQDLIVLSANPPRRDLPPDTSSAAQPRSPDHPPHNPSRPH